MRAGEESLARLRQSYRRRLLCASLVTSVPALLGLVLLGRFFVPLSPEQQGKLLGLFPPALLLCHGLWALWVLRRTRPIDQYLDRYLADDALPRPSWGPLARSDAPLSRAGAQAYRAAQLLPYALGLSKVALWLLSALVPVAVAVLRWGLDADSAALLLGEAGLVALGAALYEILWHRATLGPLLAHLAQVAGPGPRHPLSLRSKMLVAFGALSLFACGLSLSWGVLQYRAVAGPRAGGLDAETRLLIGFFVLLLIGAVGAVVLTATDLARPIRGLRRMADAIARGDLDPQALPLGLEGDEVGRLYAAFEEMRRALRDRFRSSTEVHFALEAQVARRTAELERRSRERTEALEALERAQEELVRAEKMASLGRLVAGIAHEINNPVNAVVNTAVPLGEALSDLRERVAREPDDEAVRAALLGTLGELRAMLSVLQRGARRTKEIVQTLHNYSRSDGAAPGPVDLQRCLADSLDLLQHDLKRGIVVERDFGPPLTVVGDAGQLQQVFMNLLTNAVQALAERAVDAAAPPRIRITVRPREGRAVVTISDNGPGIPQHVLPRIFDPFFTTKDVGQGSGLGLSIVHSIVQRHGGAITVDSAPGQGAAVTVALPLGPPEKVSGDGEKVAPAA